MASSSDLERATKKGKRRAENDLVELTKKGERIEALMKECEEEVVVNNCDAVPCPCSSCLGCYMRLIPEIERHLYRYGPGPSEKVTVGKMLMWKCFDAGMKDFLEYQDSQKDRTDSILVPHSIEKTRIHGFDPPMNGLWSNDLPISIDHPCSGLGMPMSLQSDSKLEKERYSEEKFQERVQIEVSNVLSKILVGNNLLATSFLQKIREATDVQPQENVQCKAHQVSSHVSSSPFAKVANTSHKDVVAHNIERNKLPLECDIGQTSTNIQENDFSVLQIRKSKKKDCRRMQQENIITESKRSLPTSKAKKQIILFREMSN